MIESQGAPLTDLYTRNGFVGPAALLVRQQYTPYYLRVEGDYAPHRLEAWQSLPHAADPRALPATILDSPRVRLDLWQRTVDTPFAVRDVHHDQVFYVLSGHARLETDFGVLDLEPLDVVRIPRAVTFRLVEVRGLELIVVATTSTLNLKPENAAVLSSEHVSIPRPYGAPAPRNDEEHELVIRHGGQTTSYFYDYDPVAIIEAIGAPIVQKFNLSHVHPLSVSDSASPPAQLIEDPTTETMIYYLGSRASTRPPVHHNADYDEIGIYVRGPGSLGALSVPGEIIWIPKGVIHQGPEENVPEGYVAWLIETRADLELTPTGRSIAVLADTSVFEVHATALQPALAT